MTPAETKFVKMLVGLARTVRRGTDPELARVAADWEIELQGRLDSENPTSGVFLPRPLRETGSEAMGVFPGRE